MNPSHSKIPTFALSLLLTGCLAEDPIRTDNTPAATGGTFSIGGLTFGPHQSSSGRSGLGGLSFGAPKGGSTYTGTRSPEEEKLRTQARKFDKTVWQGALVGAAAGTVIGLLAGKDTEDVLAGTVIGAGLGTLAGAYVASKQKQFAAREDQLASMIADVQRSNRDTRALIADARKVLEEDKRRLAEVKRRHAQGKATDLELRDTRARARSNQEVVADARDGARQQLAVYEKAEDDFRERNQDVSTNAYQAEVKRLQRNINELDGVVDQMARA